MGNTIASCLTTGRARREEFPLNFSSVDVAEAFIDRLPSRLQGHGIHLLRSPGPLVSRWTHELLASAGIQSKADREALLSARDRMVAAVEGHRQRRRQHNLLLQQQQQQQALRRPSPQPAPAAADAADAESALRPPAAGCGEGLPNLPALSPAAAAAARAAAAAAAAAAAGAGLGPNGKPFKLTGDRLSAAVDLYRISEERSLRRAGTGGSSAVESSMPSASSAAPGLGLASAELSGSDEADGQARVAAAAGGAPGSPHRQLHLRAPGKSRLGPAAGPGPISSSESGREVLLGVGSSMVAGGAAGAGADGERLGGAAGAADAPDDDGNGGVELAAAATAARQPPPSTPSSLYCSIADYDGESGSALSSRSSSGVSSAASDDCRGQDNGDCRGRGSSGNRGVAGGATERPAGTDAAEPGARSGGNDVRAPPSPSTGCSDVPRPHQHRHRQRHKGGDCGASAGGQEEQQRQHRGSGRRRSRRSVDACGEQPGPASSPGSCHAAPAGAKAAKGGG